MRASAAGARRRRAGAVPGAAERVRPLYPPGLQWYWRADFVDELTDEAIALHVEHGAELPTMHSTMHLYPIDGAAAPASASDDTAFSYRDAKWRRSSSASTPTRPTSEPDQRWARRLLDALHPYSAGGAYVNMMMRRGPERVRATLPRQLRPARRVKSRYDP